MEFWFMTVYSIHVSLYFSRRDIPQRRVKRWGYSIHELLRDVAGRDHFHKFLEKEFSAENLK